MWVKRVVWLVWGLFAFTVISVAVVLSAARILLPGMSGYQAQLEVIAERFVHHKVDIGSLDAAWSGVSPVLKLQHVEVEAPNLPAGRFEVEEVQVALDLWASLRHMRWQTAGFRVIGVDLDLHTQLQDPLTRFQMTEPLIWLLRQQSIEFERLSLLWNDPLFVNGSIRLNELNVRLENSGERHQFLLHAAVQQGEASDITLAGDLQGAATDPLQWQGKLYLQAQRLDLAMLPPVFGATMPEMDGRADIELWTEIRRQRPQWISGRVQVDGLRLTTNGEIPASYQVDELSTGIYWQHDGELQTLGLKDFSLSRDGRQVWPQTSAHLWLYQADAFRVEGDVSYLSLDEFRAFSRVIPLRTQERTNLDRLQPTGLLKDFVFRFGVQHGVMTRFSGQAHFDDIGFQGDASKPGVSGLSGRVEGDLDSGYLRLDSRRANLNLPGMFAQPLKLDYLNGVVRWQKFGDRLRLYSQQLMLDIDQVGLAARWQMDWPYREESPWMDLQVAASPIPVEKVSGFLPEKIMQPKAVSWLKQAFKAGEARNGRFLLQGRIDQLPFEHGEGRLETRFDFNDVILDYHPDWGQLDALDGQALFVGRSMQITGSSALIQGSPVERAVVAIDNFSRPVLDIKGTVGGTLAGMLDYVSSSPLGDRYGKLIDKFDALGDAHLQLDIQVPLKLELGKVKVAGSVAMSGNELLVKGEDVGLSDIRGTLNFTQDGVTAKNVKARLLDHPVRVSVYREGTQDNLRTVVDASGKLELVKLLGTTVSSLAPLLDGASNWHALLQIPASPRPDEPAYQAQLRSDLEGVSIDLPEPFGKPAEAKRDFLISWVPGQEHLYPATLGYADRANARVLLNSARKGVEKAEIRIGKKPARLPVYPGVRIAGNAAELDLGKWLSIVPLSKPADSAAGAVPVVFDLMVGQLLLKANVVRDIRLRNSLNAPWRVIASGKGASGEIRWRPAPAGDAPGLMVHLRHLSVEDREDIVSDSNKSRPVDPRDFPELDIDIDKLNWHGKAVGSFELLARRTDIGLEASRVALASEALVCEGIAGWYVRGDDQSFALDIRIADGDLGKALQLFGDSEAIHGGKLGGSIELDWLGSSGDFDLGSLEGELNLKAEKGSIEAIEEGPGKLLHLVSLNSLQRRLSLDFSDIFKGGFSFDEMSGRFVLLDGNAFTDDFTIRGNSADIAISGRTGLKARDYDQLIEVTPQLSSSLPVVGAIAGGPVVGATVLLAERLFGDQFNKVGRVYYKVTGSWDSPVYERVKTERKSPDFYSNENEE